MIILVLTKTKNKVTHQEETVVSHGIDMNTLENIILPNTKPENIGYWDSCINEWVLKSK